MSALENSARRVVAPILADFALSLDPDDQRLITEWAMKTAMVFDGMRRDTGPFYTQQEREAFAATLAIPGVSVFWIGRNTTSDTIYTKARRMWNEESSSEPAREGIMVTFVFSRLVLQILTVRPREGVRARSISFPVNRGPWSQLLLPLSREGRTIRWPPPRSFDGSEEQFDALADRLNVRSGRP